MKLPNGYGSVYKLSGHRRNPWVARKTTGWTFDEEKGKSYPVYAFIGYYPSRKEALEALSNYNQNPYDIEASKITFEEVYEKWLEEHSPKVSEATIKMYGTCFRALKDLHKMKMTDIKLAHLQGVFDSTGKNAPMLERMKSLLNCMFEYCVKYEILTKDRRDMVSYLDITKTGNPNRLERTIFTKDEVEKLWKMVDGNERFQIILCMIYTGVRIGELFNLKKTDVHLSERYFHITHAKTDAGIREVPIAEKIVPFLENRMSSDSDYVFCNTENNPLKYKTFAVCWWTPMMNELNMNHLPHDTRHTCVTMLTEAGVDERTIRKIVGHKGKGVTEAVYTHLDLPSKLEAINRI